MRSLQSLSLAITVLFSAEKAFSVVSLASTGSSVSSTPSIVVSSSAPATGTISATAPPITSFPAPPIPPLPTNPLGIQSFSFPPVGSLTRDYSTSGLAQLWDLVGSVEPPPFTTTVTPTASVVLPSPPPALYPQAYSTGPKDILLDLKLPSGFFFGVATAAYQVEGTVKDEGKGPNHWDWAAHIPGVVWDNTTADVVDLHYYFYKEDIARIAALGVNAHSFFISWSRIYPFGAADSPVNQAGLDHYADVIASHLQANITPVVTLLHWDPPLALAAYYGGFTSPEIVDDFINYAKTVFTAYNGSVHTWYTFNEPRPFCSEYSGAPFNATLAPGVNSSTAEYHCTYHVLKAHAGAVKAFREMNITGEIAFKNDDYVGIPWREGNAEDIAAVERHVAFQIGIFSDPVYTTGDWPQIVKDTLPPDFLPRFTEEEQKDLLGSADFYATDAYRTFFNAAPLDGLDACVNNTAHPNWPTCNIEVAYDSIPGSGWAVGPASDPQTSDWLFATPQWFRHAMKEIHRRWPTNKIMLSEFGFTQPFEGSRVPNEIYIATDDPDRTNYFMSYLSELLLSINEDGIPLAGAFAWAMVDNSEWTSGESARYVMTVLPVPPRSLLALSEFFQAHLP
ncbi:glycoside hydrolase [Gymnopus androsaceus JB14]|uniref:Glycoside hydrolase n=1 Tax=Gymnopus androsaceus JB14 TaxID=1447944 RepID=A0A6A4H1L5_9AGAR|nr:glycoside hydrolase [Gymnopus androsaceus JB14]